MGWVICRREKIAQGAVNPQLGNVYGRETGNVEWWEKSRMPSLESVLT